MRAVACVVFALFVSDAAAQIPPPPPPMPRDAQTQKTGTSQLSGRVLSAETGRPIRRAQVRAMSNELREGRTVSTDPEGRWVMKALPAGRYSISVSKGGYVTLQYGQRRPFEAGKPVELAEGQSVDKLEVSLPKGGVITGRILDEFGEPFSGVRVSPMRYRYVSGQRRLMATGTMDTTDDIGQYRVHGLSPGEYYVTATAAAISFDVSEDRVGYATTYFPGTPMPSDAQRVTVVEGQETQNVSFDLAPVRVATISGIATNSQGKPLANSVLMLMSPLLQSGVPVVSPTMVRPDGTFTISNVTPGEYRLQAQSIAELQQLATSLDARAMSLSESVSMPITVTGADVKGLAVTTMPTAAVRGRVVFEGGVPANTRPGSLMIVAAATNPAIMNLGGGVRVNDDWTFEGRGMTDRRMLVTSGPTGWTLKSVTVGGTDITDTGLEFKPGEEIAEIEITLTRSSPSITGTVQTAAGKPSSDYVVIAFASDAARWGPFTRFIRSVRPDQTGKFVFNSLPPGEYLVAALDYLEPGEETDPELLEKLRAPATRVSVEEGTPRALTLKVVSAR